MSKQQLRLLLCAVASVALLVPALFFMDWWVFETPRGRASISMTSWNVCVEGECRSLSFYLRGRTFPRLMTGAFGAGILVLLLVVFQSATKLFTDYAHPKVSRIGYFGAAAGFFAAFSATFFLIPDSLPLERTPAPLLFIAGTMASLAALYYAAHDGYDDRGGEYKPVVVPKKDLPVTPLSVNRVPHPGSGPIAKPASGPIAKPASGPIAKPIVERVITPPPRERIPDSIPLEGDIHARTSDSGPIPKQTSSSGSGPIARPGSGPIPKPVSSTGSSPNLAGSGTSVGMRKKSPTQPPVERTPARAPSEPPVATERTRTPSDQQPAIARTASPDRAKPPSQPGSGTSVAVPRAHTPSQQPLAARTTSPDRAQPIPARTQSPSQQPLAPRTKSPSQDDISIAGLDLPPPRAHGIDLAARLGGAPLEIAIKPPKPEPAPVPPDQIPVAPESGLVIRKRTASAAPLRSPVAGVEPPATAPAMPAISISAPDMADLALALGAGPRALRGKIKYAIASATLTSTGIAAQREDGAKKLVAWDSIVGLIARRLPNEAPFEGSSFVDVVSTAGSTLRFLPWSKIDGAPILGEGEDRVRAFLQLLAARCLDAKLDSWTKVFADGAGRAAQLPSANTLAQHDERLA